MEKLKNEKLLEIVNTIGDTPASEPELFEIIMEEGTSALLKIPNTLLQRHELSIRDFKRDEIAMFVNSIVEKIRSLKDSNGFYKETKNTTGVTDRLSYEDCISLYDYAMEQMKLDSDEDSNKDEIAAIQNKTDSLIWEIASISKENLTDWEQLLVSEQIKSCAYDTSLTALGRELKG